MTPQLVYVYAFTSKTTEDYANRNLWRAHQVLTTVDGRPGWALDTAALIEDMREVSEQVAGDYLEHVVVVRRSIVSISRVLD